MSIQKDDKYKVETTHNKKRKVEEITAKNSKQINDIQSKSLSIPGSKPSGKGEKKKEGRSQKELDETHYEFRNGLRCVSPYYFVFEVFAKGRWIGKTVEEILRSEFKAHTEDYYKKKLESGDINVNGERVNGNKKMNHGEKLFHRVHRHEPPVSSLPIEIIYEDEDIVVVNKPSSIPVHPCGRYRHNSVLFILAKEKGWKELFLIHRLDRLTSGLLILAKSSKVASKYGIQMEERLFQKVYLAKVKGKFPSEEQDVNQPIQVNIACKGVNSVKEDGKQSRTIFNLVSYNEKSDTSIVKCYISFYSHPSFS
eukprot:TRINITY_DN3115_c0_g1_i1.p1 TRINITY_DN3115_c0_g1~~TRINITY_DN3115_c0_g1_i1.p1  ORF type:complete len:310 (+),score=97.40 TRINITY_DN3115_c0_g1_i1:125-1054(+)